MRMSNLYRMHGDNWTLLSCMKDLPAENTEEFHLASSLMDQIYKYVSDATEWTYRLEDKDIHMWKVTRWPEERSALAFCHFLRVSPRS